MATKYSASVFDGQSWKGVALFSDVACFDAMVEFCQEQFENGNSLTTPGKTICIVDIETGEVVWDYCRYMHPLDDDPCIGYLSDDC